LLSIIWLNKDLYPLDARSDAAVALTFRTVVEFRKYVSSATGQGKTYRYDYGIFEKVENCFSTGKSKKVHSSSSHHVHGIPQKKLQFLTYKTQRSYQVYTLMMLINNITETPVGADLSRTPPIYRPFSKAFTISFLFC